MTNTHKQRRLTGRQEEGVDQELDGQVDYEELRVGSTTLASCEDLGSLESLTEPGDSENVRVRGRRGRGVLARLWRFLQVTATGVITRDKPRHLELELPQRYRPSTVESLCQSTGFTALQVKSLYWNFKNECPSGLVSQETFHEIFSKLFPTGANLSSYSNFIFNTMDTQSTGTITFEDFASCLSLLLTGSLEDKLRWTFRLYDLNKDGVLSRQEVREVTASIYDLMGHPNGERVKSEASEQIINRKAEMAFQRMDLDQDGFVTLEEFLSSCQEDKKMSQSFYALDIVNNM